MYTEFYGMSERPFNVTPDPKFLYLNARYREAIASLNYGISQRKGFITLIGEAGTGKTTLLKRLLEDLDQKTKSVFIFNTNVTFEEILEYIFAEFDLAVHNGKKLYMLQRLNTFLLEELRNGGNVALLIDEAQDLDYSVLEDLRLLSNLETAKEKILQIVLSGQPELGQKLGNPILRQLRQRITINCRLLPLSRDEITEYLQFRLEAAGSPDTKLFTREAEERVYHFSRGVPRLVNVVCDNALVIGYALGKKRISADIIDEAAADLLPVESYEIGSSPIEVQPAATAAPSASPIGFPTVPNRWRQWLGIAGLLAAGMLIGMLSLGRSGERAATPPADVASAPQTRFEVVRPGSDQVVGEIRPAEFDRRPEARADDPRRAPQGVRPQEDRIPPAPQAARDSDRVGDRAADRDPGIREAAPRGAVTEEPIEIYEEVPAARVRAGDSAAAPKAAEAVRADPIAPPVASDRQAVAAKPAAVEERVTAAPSAREPIRPAVVAPAAVAPQVAEKGSPPVPLEKLDPPAERVPVAVEPVREAAPRELEAKQIQEEAVADAPPVVAEPEPVAAAPKTPVQVARAVETPAKNPAAAAERATRPAEDPTVALRAGSTQLDGVSFDQMTVRAGDSVSAIAIQKYGQANPVVLDLMKLANPRLDDVDRISVGQTIRLPKLGQGFPVLTDGSGRYSVLVFSTREGGRAQSLRNALRGKGFDAVVSTGSLGRGKPMSRVLLQGFRSRDDAAAAGQRLQKLYREDSAVAQLGR